MLWGHTPFSFRPQQYCCHGARNKHTVVADRDTYHAAAAGCGCVQNLLALSLSRARARPRARPVTHKRLRLVVAHLRLDGRLEVLPAVGAGGVPALSVEVGRLVNRRCRRWDERARASLSLGTSSRAAETDIATDAFHPSHVLLCTYDCQIHSPTSGRSCRPATSRGASASEKGQIFTANMYSMDVPYAVCRTAIQHDGSCKLLANLAVQRDAIIVQVYRL